MVPAESHPNLPLRPEHIRRSGPAETIEPCHRFSSPAASTPCTDGERISVYFGSFGLLAYDFSGKEAWRRPFDRLPSEYGTATSPVLAGGQLILQRDGDSTNSQLVAISPATGRTLWESPRPLAGSCYSTPMVWRHDGIEELIVQGKGRVAAYSLKGGEPKWWVRGWGFSAVTTPVAGDGMLFAGGSGMGDPSEPDDPLFDWTRLIANHDANRDGQIAIDEMPSALFYRGRLGFVRDGAMWTLIEPATGRRVLDRERLGIGGQFSASPIAANGFIYAVNTSGTFAVLRAGDTLDVVAVNTLGEGAQCTPAIAGDRIYVRGGQNLWAFGR